MLVLNFVHLIIERASCYPRVPLIRNSIFARNVPFSQTRSHNLTSTLKNFNKNYKRLGTTEKEKKQEETQTGRQYCSLSFDI